LQDACDVQDRRRRGRHPRPLLLRSVGCIRRVALRDQGQLRHGVLRPRGQVRRCLLRRCRKCRRCQLCVHLGGHRMGRRYLHGPVHGNQDDRRHACGQGHGANRHGRLQARWPDLPRNDEGEHRRVNPLKARRDTQQEQHLFGFQIVYISALKLLCIFLAVEYHKSSQRCVGPSLSSFTEKGDQPILN
ncbi:unnamed protein product, partial [Ectocarpus sp. 12 AP-2014]